MGRTVLIIAETERGRVTPGSLEAAIPARRLARWTETTPILVILADPDEAAAQAAARDSGLPVLAIQSPQLTVYNGETYRLALADLARDLEAEYILIPHTPLGLDYGPGLAAMLSAPCLTAVEGMDRTEDGPRFFRAVYGGKAVTALRPVSRPAVVTLQPGWAPAEGDEAPAGPGTVQYRTFSGRPERTETLGVTDMVPSGIDLSEADVIVAAGRGIGKKENLALIESLAGLFSRSAVAGSRPICDNGWLEYERQVGLTGRTVSPRLYFACGISGARQHTVGMQGSGFVVAVSTDPTAAIFDSADIRIVEDLTVFIPALIEAYESGR